MNSKSKTKKVFTDHQTQKPIEVTSLNSIMRRFKSHDTYSTIKHSQSKKQKSNTKLNEGTTITINLNLPHSNLNINNWNQHTKNSKRVFSEKHCNNKKRASQTDMRTQKDSVSFNNYTNNTSRIRNQMDTMKILNEESIQELDTEENFNAIDDKKEELHADSYFTGSINETTPSKENNIKHIAQIPLFQNKFQEVLDTGDNKNCCVEPHENQNRKLIIAAKKGDKEGVLDLIDSLMNDNSANGLNFKDENGWNAMHYACDEGNLKIVEILIKTNIDLNSKSNDKKTPLHLATSHGYFDISKLLIENDAIIHCLDNEKNTPIHLCTITNHLELLKFLCDRSKNVEMKNIYGKTPMDLATKEETKNVLKQYIKKNTPAQLLNVKIHTTNTKQANTLIKHINCQGYKTPSKFINYNPSNENISNANANEKVLYATSNYKCQNSLSNNVSLRPTTSKNKFSNNVQNNNININISTNLCNISHHNSKQFKVPERVNLVVDSKKYNNNTIKANNNNPGLKSKTEANRKKNNLCESKDQKEKPIAKKKNESSLTLNNKKKDICSYSSVPKFNNERSTSQSLNKNKKQFNHKASSMPHKEDGNTKGRSKNNSQCKNLTEKSQTNITSDQIKSLSKECYTTKRKEKSLSNNHISIPNKRDSRMRIANVEISLEQGNTIQRTPEENTNEDNPIYNQITSILNLSENDDLDEEDEENDQDQPEENIDTVNKTSNFNNSNSNEEERIGPSSFICLALLGKGSFGEVYLVKKKNSKSLYAMKVLDKDKIMGQNIVKYAKTERNVLSLTSHPFIVKLNYAFQTNEKLFLLLDYCPGGDLAEQLTVETRFNEEQAKIYLCEIILALGDLHQKDIIFRDLKPDNVVLDSDGHAMLTDFGLSREGVFDAKIAKSFCGSIAYLAPEMLSRKGHGKAVDWYLLGVLFYEMLVGIPPYFTNNKEQIFKNIQSGELEIPRNVSSKASKLLRLLLKKDPNERLGSKNDVEEIKSNEYFKNVNWDSVYNRELKPPIPKNVRHALQTFKQPKMFSDNDESVDLMGLQQKFEGWSFIQNNPNINGNDIK